MRLSAFVLTASLALLYGADNVAGQREDEAPPGTTLLAPPADSAEEVYQPERAAVRLAAGQRPASGDAVVEQAPSAAERIARLERSLESDAKRLQELTTELGQPNNEYAKADASFRELDRQRDALNDRLAKLAPGGRTAEYEALEAEAAALEKKWTLARERFDLAIRERKAIQENINTLLRKLESDRSMVARLKGLDEPQPLDGGDRNPPAGHGETAHPPAAPEPAAVPLPALSQAPAGSAPAPAGGPSVPRALAKRVARQWAAASQVAQKSHDAAEVAEAEARRIAERIEILQQDIALQRQLRDAAHQHVDNAEKTLQALNSELFRKLMANENVDSLRGQVQEGTRRLIEHRQRSRNISTDLDALQSELAQLQADQLAAAGNAMQMRQAADRDQATVEQLQNPFTLRNVLQWLIDHGPRIGVILMSLGIFMWSTRVLESRLVELTAKRGRRGSREERENRAKTLLGVFRNVANIALIGGGTMMILDELGVPVAPVIGGAAVFGLAVAFGAQSLIKDYFVGFMVLLEQQYLVNDVIAIGDIKGQVERISLRITVLRDSEGRVHFVPHSQISTVTNTTHGWARAVFEISVAYKENVDRVIRVLSDLATELRNDEAYKLMILGDPVMLGVDQFANSAVVIKFHIQTRPFQQWTVKREMLRRIKNEFDRLGIEIPFPHLTIYSGASGNRETPIERSGEWPERGAA